MADAQKIKGFVSGVHNLLQDTLTPADSARDSLSWLTRDGHIELAYGRQPIGGVGAIGKNYGEHTAFKVDGTAVRFRKVATKIQYLNGTTWTDVITGLTVGDVTFANYQSLAGAFLYIFSQDGIYKIVVANPANYTSLYDEAINFKGYAFIDRGRSIFWGNLKDPTGLRGSWIDGQDGVSGADGVYTTVAAEAVSGSGATRTGTLAFKAGGATRTCFGIVITDGTESFIDNLNGVLVGSLGGTGTINYTTGAFSVTFNTSPSNPVTADYQWENSNLRGVTDFRKSATRLAGEGFVLRQDYGGDAILVVINLDGQYFSMKKSSCYRLELDSADTTPINEVFRTDIGVTSLRGAVGTGRGILFINTANPSKPRLQILARNPLGDNFDVSPLMAHFAFENFSYNDACLFSWDDYIVIGCKRKIGATISDENDRLLMCNLRNKTVDISYYGIRSATQLLGILYGGDPVSQTTFELFTGFDDNGQKIQNFWESAGEKFGTDTLKKVKRRRFKGKIDPEQSIQVYVSNDDDDYQLIGTILGSGTYVDYGGSFAIGTIMIGGDVMGGGATTNIYPFYMEIKVRMGKFAKRNIKFVATGYGFASIEEITDFDIWQYQDKMPAKYRSKQNVSLAGAVDQSTP